MKKKLLIMAGLLALCLAFSGCGDKDKTDKTDIKTEQKAEDKEQKEDDLVSMEKDSSTIDKSKITKFLGTKTATAAEVVVTNETGREISEFYMRPTPVVSAGDDEDYEESSWGADLIQDKFTLKDKERAILYYDKDNKDINNKTVKNYDLQIAYEGMDATENCFFRDLDLTAMEEITLHFDDGIPYVKYKNTVTNKEVSTLAEVKKRLGITDSNPNQVTETPEATETQAPTETPSVTETPETTEKPQPTVAPPDPAVDPRAKAEGYIGSSADSLFSDPDIGNPDGSDEDIDEETGKTVHFYYYDGFTVYAVVNDDGSETVGDVY
ncbi:MAG: hypothetical protein ACOYBE_02290 [Blautia sp.]